MAGLGERIEIRTGIEVTTVRAGVADRPAVGTGKHTFEADLIVAADGGRQRDPARLAPEVGRSLGRLHGLAGGDPVVPGAEAARRRAAGGRDARRRASGSCTPRSASGARPAARPGAASTGRRPRPARRGRSRPQTQLDPAAALVRRLAGAGRRPARRDRARTTSSSRPGEELRPAAARGSASRSAAAGSCCSATPPTSPRPTLTQGACLALEDAATLRALLRRVPGGPWRPRWTSTRRPGGPGWPGWPGPPAGSAWCCRRRAGSAVRARDAALGRSRPAARPRRRRPPPGPHPPVEGRPIVDLAITRPSGAPRRCRRCRCGGSRSGVHPGDVLVARRGRPGLRRRWPAGPGGADRRAHTRDGGADGSVATPTISAAPAADWNAGGHDAVARTRRPRAAGCRSAVRRAHVRQRGSGSTRLGGRVALGRAGRPRRQSPGAPKPIPATAAAAAHSSAKSAGPTRSRMVGRAAALQPARSGSRRRRGRAPSAAPAAPAGRRSARAAAARAWSRRPTRSPPARPVPAAAPARPRRRRRTTVPAPSRGRA